MSAPQQPSPRRHLVLLALDSLGDLVLRQPLAAALLDTGHRVTVVARSGYAGILPYLDARIETIAADVNPYTSPDTTAWQALAALRDTIAAAAPDLLAAATLNRTYADNWVLSQFPGLETFALAASHSRAEAPPASARLVDCVAASHETAKHAALFTAITGQPFDARRPALTLDDASREGAAEALHGLGLAPRTYAVVCPGGGLAAKAWPAVQCAAVAAHLRHRHGLPAVLVGAASDRPLLEDVAAACEAHGFTVPIWTGPLAALLGLLECSRVYVGNDSGPMHCAAALGVPVVARFAGAHWPRFLPLAGRSFVATQMLPCFGCDWWCSRDAAHCLTEIRTPVLTVGVDWILGSSVDEQRVDLGSAEPDQPPRTRPKVFVVTPSFNQGRYLRETIESVLGQDYPNLEYFVADGGSSDESVDILRGYGDRVRWTSGPDGGQAAAIARAWAASDAEIVAWLNSDDTYLEGAVSAAVAHLEAHPDVSLVYGEVWYTDAAGRHTRPYPTRPFDRQALMEECFIGQPGAFLRRNVFEMIEPVDASLRYVMDYDLWIRVSRYFEAEMLHRFLATARLHPISKSVGQHTALLDEACRLTERHYGHVPHAWRLRHVQARIAEVVDRLPPASRALKAWLLPWAIARYAAAGTSVPYPDGWMRPRTELSIDSPSGEVRLLGDTRQWPVGRTITMTVTYADRIIAACRVRAPARFALPFRLPPDAPRPTVVLVSSSSCFIPRMWSISSDARALSFLLTEVAHGAGDERQRNTAARFAAWFARSRWLPAAWQRLAFRAAARFAGAAVESEPYADGFVGRDVTIVVAPAADGWVVMDALLSAWPYVRPLQVRVSYAGVDLLRQEVRDIGPFSLRFRLSSGAAPAAVRLRASRTFIPAEHGVSADRRQVSFRIVHPAIV